MPDPAAGSARSSPAVSHTGTQQWQGFEMRMRHRRAERCVLRAEVALEAGFEEDARAALDEAQRLNPQTPDFETLRAAVAVRLAGYEKARRARHRRRSAGIAAAALLLVTMGVSAFWARGDGAAPVDTSEVASEVEPTETAAKPAAQPLVSSAREVPPPGTDDGVLVASAEPVRSKPASEPVPLVDPVVEPASTRSLQPEALPVPPAPPLSELEPPAAPSSTLPIERVVADLPIAEPRRDTGEAPVAAPPVAGEEPRVRAALARYESAYSGLDPSAARAVWPGVDQRSLARAFESLESQRVSLGRCSVQIDGGAARADCSGRVTWTPKIGGGTQSQVRQWQFELTNADGAWLITRAEAK